MRTLTRPELTAALAARQGLIERQRIAPAEAIRRFTPLQGQHPPAPYIALAARLNGFTATTSRRRSRRAASSRRRSCASRSTSPRATTTRPTPS